jgi:anti-sigma B factor antagonist
MQPTTTANNIAIIQPKGHVNAATVSEFHQQLNQAVMSQNDILVDLNHVDSLDSAGLMALVSSQRQAQKLQKRLSICSVSPAIRIIFELTQLDLVFDIFENRAEFEAVIA